MLFPRRNRINALSLSRASSIALLTVALVGAQIAGIAHRIRHAPGLGEQTTQLPAPSEQDQGGNRTPAHDCAAYDAAAVGDGPPLAQAAPTPAPPPQPLLAAIFSAVVDSSPHLPFHSRAPPRA